MRIGFWGNFGTNNFGNECTLHAILASARRFLPDARLLVIGNNPEDSKARHGVEALPISIHRDEPENRSPSAIGRLRRVMREPLDWLRVIRSMRRVDLLVIAGTGIVTDEHESLMGTPYQMLKWVASAKITRHKVKFLSVGTEKVTKPIQSLFLRWSLSLADYRSYRDDVSKNRALGLGGHADGPIYPDLAFSLPEAMAAPAEILTDGKSVAVGIYAVEGGAEATDDYLSAIGGFILWLLEHDYRVRIVIGDAQYDPPIKAKLCSWLSRKGALERVLDEPVASFEGLLSQLSTVDWVVATRFHNVQFSLLLNRPVVSISHMDKNDELMASMGLAEYCSSLGSTGAAHIIDLFLKLQENAAAVRASIREKNRLFRRSLEEQYRNVFESEPPF